MTFTLLSMLKYEATSSTIVYVSHFNMRRRQSGCNTSEFKSKLRETQAKYRHSEDATVLGRATADYSGSCTQTKQPCVSLPAPPPHSLREKE